MDKVALVTGGCSGIGKAICRHLLGVGMKVVAFDLQDTSTEDGGDVFIGDVTRESDINQAVKACQEEYGRLDVLVNCAGTIEPFGDGTKLNPEIFSRVVLTNLHGPYLTMQAAVPIMKKHGGGSIVNISSIAAFTSPPNFPAYSASKAGLIGLSRSMARLLGPNRIRVNVICPGSIVPTGFSEKQIGRNLRPDEITQLIRSIPLRRVGTPNDVAQAVEFLCSPAAQHITGAVISLDGGEHLSSIL